MYNPTMRRNRLDCFQKGEMICTVNFWNLLKLAFAAINFQIDEALFNTLVLAIAAYFLSLFGGAVAARMRPATFKAEE